MDINELIYTDMVLKTAKDLRKQQNAESLNEGGSPPPLDGYIKPAIKQLEAWRKYVMEEKAQLDQEKAEQPLT